MKFTIETNEMGEVVLKEVFSGILLETEEGNQMGICMRDDTFEFSVFNSKGQFDYRVDMKTGEVVQTGGEGSPPVENPEGEN